MPATKVRTKKGRPVSAEVPEEVEAEEKDYSTYLEKEPTDLQERFADWILDKTGYEPTDADDFATGVQLATALRMEFQRSPENQAVLEERRAAAEERAEEKATKPAAKRGRPRKTVEPVEDADEPEEAEEEAPKPTRKRPAARTAKAGATKTSKAKAGATRTRRPRQPKAETEEAPF
jgi:hypothetical protein